MAIKCILFDADGVIINSQMFSIQYQNKYAVPNDDMITFFRGDFQNCIIGKADLIESLRTWLPVWKWERKTIEFSELNHKSKNSVTSFPISILVTRF